MATPRRLDRFFAKPVVPVLWDVGDNRELVAQASSVILQGGAIADLPRAIEQFDRPPLDHLRLLVHIDLLAGLEKSEAGLELLAATQKVDGVVTVHHHVVKPAKRMGFLTIVRVFLSDSRALERGLRVAAKSGSDVVELLPAAAAIKVAAELRACSIPYIAGGLCRTEDDILEARRSGSLAVTSTRPELWGLNH